MKTLRLRRLDTDTDSLKGRKPISSRIQLLHPVKDDTLFIDDQTGEPLGCYVMLPEPTVQDMRRVAQTTKVTATARAYEGLPTKSAVFGMVPRTPIRQDYCRFTQNSINEPENHAIVREFARKASSIYEELFPQNYREALQGVQEIHPEWLMPGTPFATCNFNFNHAIKYHRDTGNISTAFSNVLVLREHMLGGQLLFPEYGLCLAQQDRAFSIFNGNRLLHGVLPIRRTDVKGYRASIVYYTLAGTRNCLCMQAELERIREKRLEKERRRLEGMDPRDTQRRKQK